MKTIEEMNQALSGNGYSIEKAISGYYYCQRNNEDGTQTTVWMDSACEDAYDLDAATEMAYEIVMEGVATYTFMGNCEELSEPFEIETTEYYSIEQARERAEYLLGNYNDKGYVLTSVDIYVGNDYKESAE